MMINLNQAAHWLLSRLKSRIMYASGLSVKNGNENSCAWLKKCGSPVVTPICLHMLCMCMAMSGCSGRKEWRQSSGMAWGTTYNITYYADRDLSDSIIAVMRNVELEVSPFEVESQISRVNRGETDTLSTEVAYLFRESQRIAQISGGAFDPTVAPLVNLWGFGYRNAKNPEMRPDSLRIAEVMQRVGIDKCKLGSDNVLRRKHRHTELDFSAIAKGYGIDCLARMLKRNGCSRSMVEVGGEVRFSGKSPSDADWRIQIDSPLSDSISHKRLTVVSLTDASMATSGNYRNFRQLSDGSIVSHTISPLTGRPVRSKVLSVTVVAPNCMTADALATACMAMPYEDAKFMIASLKDISALFVTYPDSLKIETVGTAFNGVHP